MKTLNWKSTVMWPALSLLFLTLALTAGPAPALAATVQDTLLYEVTEDMYLVVVDGSGAVTRYVTSLAEATHRQAVAQLSGLAKLGTPLCPYEVLASVSYKGVKECVVNATGSDLLALGGPNAGKGTVEGTFAVVVQDTNTADAPEFVVMTGSFRGNADLSLAFAGTPLGFITGGVATIDGGGQFDFTGTFRLPFALGSDGKNLKPRRHGSAFYLGDAGQMIKVKDNERSLGFPAVRLEIGF